MSNKVELHMSGNFNVDSETNLEVLKNQIQNSFNNLGISTNVNLMRGGPVPLPTPFKRYCLTSL